MPATERPEKRRKVVSAASRPEVIDVVKNPVGDLVIRAGETINGSLICVHSAFLRMVSPVFRAMLGGNFVEGSTQYTAENPLRLTEDDGQAMLDLCTLLHHQYTMKYSLPLSQFPNLVMLADKYQCLSTVRPWFLSAVSQHFSAYIDESPAEIDGLGLGLGDAMCIAYAVEDAQLFWRISRTAIVHTHTTGFSGRIMSGLVDLMPKGFVIQLYVLQRLQAFEHRRLVQALEEAEANLLEPVNLCNKRRYLASEYVHRLHHRDLKRANVETAVGYRLTRAYDEIEDVAKSCDPSTSYEIRKIQCSRVCHNCPTSKFKDELFEIVKTSKRDCRALCLECVQTAGGFKVGEKCGHKFRT